MKSTRRSNLTAEFQRQIQNVLAKKYPSLAGMSEMQFLRRIKPLQRRLAVAAKRTKSKNGQLPFVVVVKSELAPAHQAMRRVVRDGKRGIVSMQPVKPHDFKPIKDIKLPKSKVYIITNVDRGADLRNVTPEKALRRIRMRRRSPLTLEEGIAVVTHFPNFLQKNNCFSLPGSRRGDQRVPALWLSGDTPKLGWCWDRNPHTWLGSASCGARY